ncbi:hypothetical protein K435DRAFT_873126 [Dendrothele bispora CBS 962.96]|uniref:Uncharacterized protein n=1 Tax=Dendrothele bispora (strain CBS 962.96) TaxID=1314807 RepID=A0A4S8KZS7_DENBC|nr:hypothetical protein K435DRAFT_873126 [Dendrothele bispora CBS 962.96]
MYHQQQQNADNRQTHYSTPVDPDHIELGLAPPLPHKQQHHINNSHSHHHSMPLLSHQSSPASPTTSHSFSGASSPPLPHTPNSLAAAYPSGFPSFGQANY